MGLFRLQIEITGKNLGAVEEIRQRLKDFSVPFLNIVKEWAVGNRRKFAQGRGAENSGTQVDGLAFWQPLRSRTYQRWKRKKAYPDWLMRATGSLTNALTSMGGFASFVDTHRAVFGVPLNLEDANKALYNRELRPTIFLGRSDRNMIRREMQRYLSMGEGYREMMFSKAGHLAVLRQETMTMDQQFAEAVSDG